MKLIDLLVRELPKHGGWPDGVDRLNQGHDGDFEEYRNDGNSYFPKCRINAELSDNYRKPAMLVEECRADFVTREQYEAALAASKQQWDGEGLPPVGCECEVKVGGDYFNLCRVVYSDKSCGVAFVYLGGDDEKYCGQIDCVSAKASSDYFRPIHSEADKKRAKGVIALSRVDPLVVPFEYGDKHSDGSLVAPFWYELYDTIAAGKVDGIKLED